VLQKRPAWTPFEKAFLVLRVLLGQIRG